MIINKVRDCAVHIFGRRHGMNQPVPKVSNRDVKRIAKREFGKERPDLVMAALEEFGKQDWNRPGSPRVRLAILKLACGDPEKVSAYTRMAIEDFRDVVSMAEYPRYMKEVGLKTISEETKQAAIEEDWLQYREWLKKR
jgi:hypothetical protein